MFKERNKAVPAVYAMMRKDDEILLLQRAGTNYFPGWYTPPSGHVEAGELPITALIRETKEEIGVDIKAEDVKLVHALYREKEDETGQRADYFFEVDKWSGDIVNVEPHKCTDISWHKISNLPEKTIPYIKKVIEDIEKGAVYSEI